MSSIPKDITNEDKTEFRVTLKIHTNFPCGLRDGSWRNCIERLDKVLKEFNFLDSNHDQVVDVVQKEVRK